MDTKKTQDFEKKLSRTLWLALVAALLHKATTWVGGSALTWATVVLMGGFASNLAISDFVDVTLLVILIVFLLTVALFTCKLVTKRSLSTGSLQPLKLTYQDKRLLRVNAIKSISFLLQCALLILCFDISASNLQRPAWNSVYSYVFSKPHVDQTAAFASLQACLQSCATSHHVTDPSALQACAQLCFPEQNSTTNLQVCLFTFYSLVTATCILGLLCNLYILIRIVEAFWLMYWGHHKTLSLTRYHDEVLSRALNFGLVEADEFDAREFLLRGVGEDLVVRNIAPLEVKRQNEDFIKYLLYHSKGVEMVMGMLASENSLLQQTAANMPGFWSTEPAGIKKYGMELLSRLGEKLGMPGKVAEGAANSFKALAIAWKEEEESPLLQVYVSRSGGGRTGGRESIRKSSKSEAAGRGSGGSREPSHAGSKSGGGGGGQGAAPAADESSCTSGGGEGSGECGGQGGGERGRGRGSGDEVKWNVVQVVVDLVAKKRLPTLQVYVRALDSFFMSESVRKWLATEEREMYDAIKAKLKGIIQGDSTPARSHQDHTSVPIDAGRFSIKVRTRLLAFSAWDRLRSDGAAAKQEGYDLLKKLDAHISKYPILPPLEEKLVIWIDEVARFRQVCAIYEHQPRGLNPQEWPPSDLWVVHGDGFATM